jgi:hypothetical protein
LSVVQKFLGSTDIRVVIVYPTMQFHLTFFLSIVTPKKHFRSTYTYSYV